MLWLGKFGEQFLEVEEEGVEGAKVTLPLSVIGARGVKSSKWLLVQSGG
jgi:hypothetical protein